MPLINGIKMACEPCIRGHRSTKCNHASERLMVPVRKPGRPLSSCPHPQSKPCSCASVTAAIPRKQTCRCEQPPKKEEPSENGSMPQSRTASPDAVPTSPDKGAAGPASFRVKKAAVKDSSSRKQSVDVANLERMDPSQLNILPTNDFANEQSATMLDRGSTAPTTHSDGSTMISDEGTMLSGPGPASLPMFQRSMPAAANPSLPSSAVNQHVPNSRSADHSVSSTAPNKGSCCGGSNGAQGQTNGTVTPMAKSNLQAADQGRKSCCSSNEASQNGHHSSGPATPYNSIPPPTGMPTGLMMPQLPMPMAVPNGMYPFFPQPTVFTYPPHYGSYLHPLQPEQWRQVMAALNLGPAQAGQVAYNMPSQIPFPAVNGTTNVGSITHQCQCGDGCQCVGCAAHPYNDATQDYVRSAWKTMAEDARVHNQEEASGQTNGTTDGDGHSSTSKAESNGVVAGAANSNASPPVAITPPETGGEEQTLSENDFFFVSYPFDGSCEGDTASCPCGDDCQCIGCVIHNNPGPDS